MLAATKKVRHSLPANAWQQILWENVVYLADDETRARAMDVLREHTDLVAETIEKSPDELLTLACGQGRMATNQIRKLRSCAELFRTVGDPCELVKLPAAQARKALKKFPAIGDPGVDRLLMFGGVDGVLALDSNGMRVLLRLGYGREAKSYATSYRSAKVAAMAELPAKSRDLQQAYGVLRELGKTICRNAKPECWRCAMANDCPSSLSAPE